MEPLIYRVAAPSDMALVVSTWSDSYRTSRAAGLISMARWRQVMAIEIADILARDGVAIHVACHPDEESGRADVYGWIATERGYEIPVVERYGGRHERRLVKSDVPLVLYVYTKEAYRRMGIARGLFKAAGVGPRFNYACRTSVVSKLAGKFPDAEWLHLVCRYPKTKNPRGTVNGERISSEVGRAGAGQGPARASHRGQGALSRQGA